SFAIHKGMNSRSDGLGPPNDPAAIHADINRQTILDAHWVDQPETVARVCVDAVAGLNKKTSVGSGSNRAAIAKGLAADRVEFAEGIVRPDQEQLGDRCYQDISVGILGKSMDVVPDAQMP